MKGCRDVKPLLTRTQSQHSLQAGPERRENTRLSPDRPRPAPESPRQAEDRLKTGPSHVKTIQDGPKTSQDRLNFEAQAFKKTFACEGFRDFRYFQKVPKAKTAPRQIKRRQDSRRQAQDNFKTASTQSKTGPGRPRQAQHSPTQAQHMPRRAHF